MAAPQPFKDSEAMHALGSLWLLQPGKSVPPRPVQAPSTLRKVPLYTMFCGKGKHRRPQDLRSRLGKPDLRVCLASPCLLFEGMLSSLEIVHAAS